MSLLNQLPILKNKSHKRVGRGFGSGKGGHTAGRGTKGQNSRAGAKSPLWFEGGQLPLIKRMPMLRGKGRFNPIKPTVAVSLSDLENMKADRITFETLRLEKVVPARARKAKIIATGQISRSVVVEGVSTSTQAAKLIKAAGGSVQLSK